jgi:hypothetical protein
MELAKYLASNAVHAIFDQWDVRPGQDIVTFMEQIRDENIEYALILCDKTYKEKADTRTKGAGKETLMIANEVYENPFQIKYIPIIMERDDNGEPYIPIFLEGRDYIDLSDEDTLEYEKLLRHIFDKPLFERPPLGKHPNFDEPEGQSKFDIPSNFKPLKAIEKSSPGFLVICEDFFTASTDSLEQYRVTPSHSEPYEVFCKRIVKSIEDMKLFRDNVLDVITKLVRYADSTNENTSPIHKFSENIYTYTKRPEHVYSYRDGDFDNFCFLLYELFLYTIATCLKYEKFHMITPLLNNYLSMDEIPNAPMVDYTYLLYAGTQALNAWNAKLRNKWVSPIGQLLKQRAQRPDIQWEDVLQADIFLCIKDDHLSWSRTAIYLPRSKKLPLFARSTSKRYAMRFLPILGCNNPDDFKQKVSQADLSDQVRLGLFPTSLQVACNVQYIATSE